MSQPPITIEARRYNNRTGVILEAGATYELTAEGRWRDASIECGPDGHDAPKLRWLRWTRRSRPNLWFALMGTVAGKRFLIGSKTTVTIEKTGELVCFANDAPVMYWNNSGAVTLTIRRV